MWFTGTMTDLETMPVERVDVLTEEITETGEPTAAHIVKTKRGENAAAVVLEARVMGTPIEALCGFVWVPSRDPKQLPVCEKCKSVYSMFKAFKQLRADLPRITIPVLYFRSAEDHVVDISSSRAINAAISSRDFTETILENSHHVATLDNDATKIFAESAEFIARVTGRLQQQG